MTSGKDADNAALCDALSVEHSTIYGYGIVSALSPPGVEAPPIWSQTRVNI